MLLGFITFYSCDETIFEQDISEKAITVLAPTGGTSVITGTVSFNWNKLQDSIRYQVQIATPDFIDAAQIVTDTITAKTSYVINLEVDQYQWRVRAINSTYETPYTTTSFTVD